MKRFQNSTATHAMDYIIGVDLDNTLVSYDEVMHRVAVQEGLIPMGAVKNKQDIRDRIQQSPDGELQWRKLQAIVYGPKMGEAKLIDGVRQFFDFCKRHRVKVYIVSHKAEYATLDETGISLRAAAISWMRSNRFFNVDGLGLSEGDVYFESTRREKINRIRQLGCTHFIDDLEETFLEESFPVNVEKILYAPHTRYSSLRGVKIANSWEEMRGYFFDGGS